MAKTPVDLLLVNLNQLINFEDFSKRTRKMRTIEEIYSQFSQFSDAKKLQMEFLGEELSVIRRFLKDSEMSWSKHEEVKDLVSRISKLAYKADDIITSYRMSSRISGATGNRFRHDFHLTPLCGILKEIVSIKKEVLEIYAEKLYGIGSDPESQISWSGSGSGSGSSSSRAGEHEVEDNIVVGFDDEMDILRCRVARQSSQLDVVSIVGMAGLGKTTLAKKLYSDPFVAYHFHVRGWTYVSQVYRKRDLLLGILSSVVQDKGAVDSMGDEQLGETLYKRLKGKRYLIVMDDIWNAGAWDEMKIYFPNDKNGSKIVLTTRLVEVGLHAKPDSLPHSLRFLNHDESWDLLSRKVFQKESFPLDLVDIGKQIALKCQGLPLAIVVVSGILAKTKKSSDKWRRLAGSLSSHIGNDPNKCMYTLALSYNHLPHHLKLCFLYFGAFPEDYEIPARKLTWLWIAEGFIRQNGRKSLEDVAEEYLMDLIDRSLVSVTKKSSTGGIKACHVHDLLHDFCLRKGKEDNFMKQFSECEYDQISSASSSSYFPILPKQRRISILSHLLANISVGPPAPHIRTLLCFISKQSSSPPESIPYIPGTLRLLRVLDLSVFSLLYFPSQIVELVSLRYLALSGMRLNLPESISDVLNLETLIVSQVMYVPPNIWKMVKLRRMCIAGLRGGSMESSELIPSEEAWVNNGYPSLLHNLQTILEICPSKSSLVILEKTPNLRKLGFSGDLVSDSGYFWFPNLDFLNYLETLKLINRNYSTAHLKGNRCSLRGLRFPPSLRRLTLAHTYLKWEEMSILSMLCKLEVLKLDDLSCIGSQWETSDGGFQKLKHLRLKNIDIQQWEASSAHFPRLQRLVLQGCKNLKEIPFELGYLSTLETIEVRWCSQSTKNSARKIQEEQQSWGNDLLKIFVSS